LTTEGEKKNPCVDVTGRRLAEFQHYLKT